MLAGLVRPPLPGEFPKIEEQIDFSSSGSWKYLWYGWSAPEREIPEDWDPATASAVVWSGNDEGMAQILGDCLRENGIGSRSESDTTAHRLLVQPEDADAAREIVREVIEGTPPG